MRLPKFWSLRMKVVNKMNFSRPYNSFIIFSRMMNTFQKNILLFSFAYSYSIFKWDSNINQRDIVKVIILKYFSHFLWRIIILINCKYSFIFHIVKIWPHCVNWNSGLFKILYDLSKLVQWFITPSRLMIP